MSNLVLYNSLTKRKEEFKPINPPQVGMYTCGMTVYDYAHIGHGRKYTYDDILRRTLTFNGFKVNHVQNVTDVGHLASDGDEGEDKMEKGAKKAGKSVWEVAEFFTNNFYETMDKLNILRPNIIAKATEHISDQIKLVETLVEKGYAYDTPEAVYFDVSKFDDYGKLFGQSLEQKRTAVREEVQTGDYKKNPQDFALWFKRVGRFENHAMHWESPWGEGFPGWHIECSAMSMKYLGDQFDIHTGGEDHLSIHHPNEIAQSEAATGKKPFARYWIHYAFLTVDGQKMSKSLGNYFTLKDVEEKGYDPMALRYLYLSTHYKKPLNFTWEALDNAQNSLNNLRQMLSSLLQKREQERTKLSEEKLEKIDIYSQRFQQVINDDLNTPQALAVMWEAVKSNIPSPDKVDLLYSFDEVLGLNLRAVTANEEKPLPAEIKQLIDKRNQLRAEGKFEEADSVRNEIEQKGYSVQDTKINA